MFKYRRFVTSNMAESDLIPYLKTISEDIHWIRKDIARLARKSYLEDLEKVANTPARQEIWRQCDGSLSSDEIAKKIGITTRSVQYFVQDAEKKGLTTSLKRGYPIRTDSFDEIPVDWKPYKKSSSKASADVVEEGH